MIGTTEIQGLCDISPSLGSYLVRGNDKPVPSTGGVCKDTRFSEMSEPMRWENFEGAPKSLSKAFETLGNQLSQESLTPILSSIPTKQPLAKMDSQKKLSDITDGHMYTSTGCGIKTQQGIVNTELKIQSNLPQSEIISPSANVVCNDIKGNRGNEINVTCDGTSRLIKENVSSTQLKDASQEPSTSIMVEKKSEIPLNFKREVDIKDESINIIEGMDKKTSIDLNVEEMKGSKRPTLTMPPQETSVSSAMNNELLKPSFKGLTSTTDCLSQGLSMPPVMEKAPLQELSKEAVVGKASQVLSMTPMENKGPMTEVSKEHLMPSTGNALQAFPTVSTTGTVPLAGAVPLEGAEPLKVSVKENLTSTTAPSMPKISKEEMALTNKEFSTQPTKNVNDMSFATLTTSEGKKVPQPKDERRMVEIKASPIVVEDNEILEVAKENLAVSTGALNPSAMPTLPTMVMNINSSVQVQSHVSTPSAAHAQMMVAAAESVMEAIRISPTLATTGNGEINIQLKHDVLDGSVIRLEVKGGDLKILIVPTSSIVEEIFMKHQEAFQTHLAERVTQWRINVGVAQWGARTFGNYRSEDEA